MKHRETTGPQGNPVRIRGCRATVMKTASQPDDLPTPMVNTTRVPRQNRRGQVRANVPYWPVCFCCTHKSMEAA